MLALVAAMAMAPNDPMEAILERHLDSVRRSPDVELVAELVANLGSDGSWTDVDYAANGRTNYAPQTHADRLVTLADSVHAGDAAATEAFERAVAFLVSREWQADNWWFDDIGIPMRAARALVLVRDRVSEPTLDGLAKLVAQSGIDKVPGPTAGTFTGQNLVWRARNALILGAFRRDEALVARAAGLALQECRFTTEEGIQIDASFHQHGPQLMTGSYGASFLNDMARTLSLLHGTPWAADEAQLMAFRTYALEGVRWSLQGGAYNWSTTGREIARSRPRTTDLRPSFVRSFAEFDPDARDAYLEWAETLDRQGPPYGVKSFWRTEFTTMRRPGFAASVKTASNRLLVQESGNGENLLGTHLTDGVTLFYRRARDYRWMPPVWDWHKLPGTTTIQDEILEEPGWAGRPKTDFSGAATDGEVVVHAVDFRGAVDGPVVSARKAWFMVGSTVLAVGDGVASQADAPVATTLDQRAVGGGAWVRVGEEWSPLLDSAALASGSRLWTEGVGYEVRSGVGRAEVRVQEGSMRRISDSAGQSDDPKAVRAFVAWIDHGVRPSDDGYAYAVFRADTRDAEPDAIEALESTAFAQAAWVPDESIVLAVFYAPGTLETPAGSLSVDLPSLVVWRSAEARAFVASPLAESGGLSLGLDGRSFAVDLPSGAMVGSTVAVELD